MSAWIIFLIVALLLPGVVRFVFRLAGLLTICLIIAIVAQALSGSTHTAAGKSPSQSDTMGKSPPLHELRNGAEPFGLRRVRFREEGRGMKWKQKWRSTSSMAGNG